MMAKVDWDFRIFGLVNPDGTDVLNPVANFGEVRRAQIAKSILITYSLVPLRSFKVCSDIKERVRCGKEQEATAPIKSLVKLQPWFLSLRWKTCLRQNCSLGLSACREGPAFGQNPDDDECFKFLYNTIWKSMGIIVLFSIVLCFMFTVFYYMVLHCTILYSYYFCTSSMYWGCHGIICNSNG